MKRVLLTGASGFIGRHCIAPLLANGYEVHAVTTHSQPMSPSLVQWHRVDLLDTTQMATLVQTVCPTHVLHLAWHHTVPGQFWSATDNVRWVEASLALLRAFQTNHGQRIVMAGTCAEYDWRYGYCSETVTPIQPATLYGSAKHALHSLLMAFAAQTHISAAWGRIFFLYGPYEYPNRLVASVIRSGLRNEAVRCSHGNQIRDFLHVQDAADGFVALLESNVDGAVNIASGQPLALKDLIRKIPMAMEKVIPIEWGAIPTPPDEPPLLVAAVRRLTMEVGWQPRIVLDEGLAQTIDWWRHEINH